jgi:tetratricopeptide (TPR) repeat protein
MKKVILTGILLLILVAGVQAELQDVSGMAKTDLRSANNYYRQKVFDKALNFYLSVLEANPYHIESLYNVGGIYYEIEQDYETAYKYYSRTLGAIDSLYAEYESIKAKDEKEGKKYYKKYIQKEDIEDKHDKSVLLLANCWTYMYQDGFEKYQEEKYEQALEHLTKLYELAPDSVLTVKMIANSHMLLENSEEAIKYYQKAFELEPDNEKNAQLIANKYYQLEDMENAVKWYQIASEIAPENPDNYYNMGVCYTTLEQKEEALAMFARTLEYEPENIDAIFNAKIIAQQLGDMDAYLQYAEMEFEINGYTADNLKVFCYQLNSLEAYEAVLKYGKKWAELAPNDPAPYQLMFLAANKLGRKQLAEEYQKKLQEIK